MGEEGVMTSREKLIRIIEDARERPFKWGQNDCGTLFRELVMALGGADPFAGAKWKDRKSAERALKKLGSKTVAARARKVMRRVKPGEARDFDFGVVDTGDALTSPYVLVGRHLFGIGETGPVTIRREAARAFLRVREGH